MLAARSRTGWKLGKLAWLASLVVLFTLWSQDVGSANASGFSPITMQATWGFSPSSNVDQVPGVWLAGVESANQDARAVALVWLPDANAWYPTWRLILASETGMLPVNIDESKVVPGWGNSYGIDLGSLIPEPGHSYQPLISYDPKNGALSVSLTDLTTHKQLVSRSVTIHAGAKQLVPSSGQLESMGSSTPNAVTITDLNVFNYYVPVGTDWQICVPVDNKMVAVSSISTETVLYIRINAPGTPLAGQYRLLLSHQGEIKQLPVHLEVNDTVALPIGELPLGPSDVILEYVEQGQVTFRDMRPILIGKASAKLSKVTVDAASGSLYTNLIIESQGPLSGLDINAQVVITEMVWNATTKDYLERTYRQEVISVRKGITVPSNSPVPIPIPLTVPPKPGLWKLSVIPMFEPVISLTTIATPMLFNTYSKSSLVSEDGSLTMAVMPDTQMMSVGFPQALLRDTQWMLANMDKQKIDLMLHVGDITHHNSSYEWENAQEAFSQLDGSIPYVMALGNHDMGLPGTGGTLFDRGQSQVQKYFPPTSFTGLQGYYPERLLNNTFHTFHINGVDYLVISLEYAPLDAVLDWANQVVSSHPNHKTIILTHAYLNTNGTRMQHLWAPTFEKEEALSNYGVDIWSKLVRKHKNIFLVVCGHNFSHVSGLPYNISQGIYGNKILELLVDFQGEPNGGNGWLALLEIKPSGTVSIRTYSPFLDAFKTDVSEYGFGNMYEFDLQ